METNGYFWFSEIYSLIFTARWKPLKSIPNLPHLSSLHHSKTPTQCSPPALLLCHLEDIRVFLRVFLSRRAGIVSAWMVLPFPPWTCPQRPQQFISLSLCSRGIWCGIGTAIYWALAGYQALCLTKHFTDTTSFNLPSSPVRSLWHFLRCLLTHCFHASFHCKRLVLFILAQSSNTIKYDLTECNQCFPSEWRIEWGEIRKPNKELWESNLLEEIGF